MSLYFYDRLPMATMAAYLTGGKPDARKRHMLTTVTSALGGTDNSHLNGHATL